MLLVGIIAVIAGILLVLADAHARRRRHRQEQAILHSEKQGLLGRLAALESRFPQAVVMMDAQRLIRRVNPAAERLFGFAEGELLGHDIFYLLPFAPDGTQDGAEIEAHCKNQSLVKVRPSGIRVDSPGRSAFYIFFETGPLLPAPLALVERVVGRITSRFEELLTAINGYSELALHAAPEEGPLRQHLEEIVAASEQASNLARNLLAFSGSQVIPLETVDLNVLAQQAAHHFPGALELDLPPEAPPLALANRESLQQVLQLLIDSAGKSGSIHIQTSRRLLDRPRTVYSGEVPAGSFSLITVAFAGMFLDAEVVEHMFEPMYLHLALHGVDLSPIYGIITSLGGRLHIESDGLHGTTFEIWLPAESQSRGTMASGNPTLDRVPDSRT